LIDDDDLNNNCDHFNYISENNDNDNSDNKHNFFYNENNDDNYSSNIDDYFDEENKDENDYFNKTYYYNKYKINLDENEDDNEETIIKNNESNGFTFIMKRKYNNSKSIDFNNYDNN
jgi:hypothetical protein